jgi:t-SNARE complex subunit (syntaxin)
VIRGTHPIPAYKARAIHRALRAKLARQHAQIEAMHTKLMAQVQQMREAQEAHDRAMSVIAVRPKGVGNA